MRGFATNSFLGWLTLSSSSARFLKRYNTVETVCQNQLAASLTKGNMLFHGSPRDVILLLRVVTQRISLYFFCTSPFVIDMWQLHGVTHWWWEKKQYEYIYSPPWNTHGWLRGRPRHHARPLQSAQEHRAFKFQPSDVRFLVPVRSSLDLIKTAEAAIIGKKNSSKKFPISL